jgi:hypothetical protein
MKNIRWRDLTVLTLLLAFLASCGREDPLTGPVTQPSPYAGKDGTETLGVPSIPIAPGSGFAEGGLGMNGVDQGTIEITVPVKSRINQVLAYWAGATTTGTGDPEIVLGGVPVQGDLIGGPTNFFADYDFYAYRADVTHLDLVAPGANAVEVSGFDFTVSPLDENDGVSLLVIYDQGPAARVSLRDGLDMAFFGFEPTLDATVPQVFFVDAEDAPRSGQLFLAAASVGEDRPNRVLVSTAAGDQVFDDVLSSGDGPLWDSVLLTVDIPAGVDELSVQLVSTDSTEPLGASLGWVAAGLVSSANLFDVAGTVFVDADLDAAQGPFELGIENVWLELEDSQGQVQYLPTAPDGGFLFQVPAGDYTLRVPLGTSPAEFNFDLAQSFAATGVLEVPVTVGPDASGLDFGFVPRPDDILADIESGELEVNGRDIDFWRQTLARVVKCEDPGQEFFGELPEIYGLQEGVPFREVCNPADGDYLREYLDLIEGLLLPDPYVFTDGQEIEDAYRLLLLVPNGEVEEVLQEMLVTQLNYAAGLGLPGEEDRLLVLFAWAEALINLETNLGAKSGLKDFKGDLRSAFQIFEAINTGGGGGVDE